MNIRLHLSLLLYLMCTLAVATPLSRQQALMRVQAVLGREVAAARAPLAARANQATSPYYIFGGENSFIIASGDDRLPAVLGYSDNSVIDPNDMPEGLKLLLEQYEHMTATGTAYKHNSGTLPGHAIAPLIKTRWGQLAPFNKMCPALDTLGNHANTGGVATAMAQIMRFFYWPSRTTIDLPAYISYDLMIEVPAIENEPFPLWNNIKEYYYATDIDSTAVAVAQLMRFCSQSVKTNFSTSSTSTLANAVPALVNYFNYANTARYVQRKQFSAQQWAQMLRNEIAARRPVIYRAQRHDGVGQAFLCDGIDENGLVHINWGWQGSGDGYFRLTEINPNDSIGSDAYGLEAAMVIGIQSTKFIDPAPVPSVLSFHSLSLPLTQYTRPSSSDAFDGVIINGRFTNATFTIDNFDLGFALHDSSGNCIKTFSCATINKLAPTYGVTRDWTVNIGSDLAPGHYSIRPVSRVSGSEQWHLCTGSDGYWIDAHVDGNVLTLVPQGNGAPGLVRIDNVTMTGTMQARRAVEASVSVTNIGEREFNYIYLLLDGTCVTAATCEMAQGDRDTVTMRFTPAEAGNHEVMLALDRNGESPLWHGNVNTIDPVNAQLEFSNMKLADMRTGRIIVSGTMSVTAKVTNKGTQPFDDVVVAQFYRQTTKRDSVLHATCTQALKLAPGEAATITINAEHLNGDELYNVALGYYDASTLVHAISSPFYTMLGDLKAGDLNGDRAIDIKDVSLLINELLGRPPIMDYEGRQDVNNDGSVDVNDLNRNINTVLGKDYK